MAGASCIVGNKAGNTKTHGFCLAFKAVSKGCHGPGHAPGIEDKDNRQVQGPGTVCGTACRIARFDAVKKPHGTFGYAAVSLMAQGCPQLPDAIFAHHPGIQVAGWLSCCRSMKAGINVVRTAFESLDFKPPVFQGTHQGDSDGCLSLA